jgi:uncharacterized protein (TIGR02594 family)
MRYIQTNALEVASRYIGTKELPGHAHNPIVLAMFERAGAAWIRDDETAWCSAFAHWITFKLGLQRPALPAVAARKWLTVGEPVGVEQAEPGLDVVILQRGDGPQPGPAVLNAQGHVAFFDRLEIGIGTTPSRVVVVGGNQSNMVSRASFPASRILGIRRLVPL